MSRLFFWLIVCGTFAVAMARALPVENYEGKSVADNGAHDSTHHHTCPDTPECPCGDGCSGHCDGCHHALPLAIESRGYAHLVSPDYGFAGVLTDRALPPECPVSELETPPLI